LKWAAIRISCNFFVNTYDKQKFGRAAAKNNKKKDFLKARRIILIEVEGMLLDTNSTIAYKCSCCGAFEFFEVSLFQLVRNKPGELRCRCGETSIQLTRTGQDGVKLSVPCFGCGNDHVFVLKIREIIKDITMLSCPVTGMQQCFIGSDEQVRHSVDCVQKEMDEMIDHLGYESYFANSRVMLDAVNRVHDIAEKRRLMCECGNKDIEMFMLSDKIQLVCKKCLVVETIDAASNEDLKQLFGKREIILTGHGVRNPGEISFKK
jgi:hypothetical protein